MTRRRALGSVSTNAAASSAASYVRAARAEPPAWHPCHIQRRSMLQVPSSHRSSSTYASAGPGYVSATAGAGAQAAAHVDIDAPTAHDPTQFVEYVQDIYKHYRKDEVTKVASPSYMAHQSDINEKMRAILVDWLVEVHLKFKLMPETMFLTVNLIDRFLERKLVARQKLQLVGVTAMLLASKYEEIYAPEVRDFVFITDRAYNREQILSMESAMLTALGFNVTCPTALHFMNRFLKAARVADETGRLKYLVRYYVERTMQEYSMLKYLPSITAAAAVNIAMRSLGLGTWDATLTAYTGFTEAQLQPCVQDMEHILEYAPTANLQAVRKKYSSSRYREVAKVPLVRMQ
ncbi:unnamed protein product [Symbiodinium sp. KB8]|nr:unnamed protein product [Symbiodinium sp. KB8]